MKIVNIVVIIVVISALLFLSVGFASAVDFLYMNDIITEDSTPSVEFLIIDGIPSYVCNLYINDIPSGVDIVEGSTHASITCNRTLEVGLYEYYISAYDEGETPPPYYNSGCYTLQITSSWGGGAVEAIGYLDDGFQHIGDSTESLLLWGIIFCATVILLGMIAMFIKALRG